MRLAGDIQQKYWQFHKCLNAAVYSLQDGTRSSLPDCERTFGSAKKLIIAERNKLGDEIIEASEYLKV